MGLNFYGVLSFVYVWFFLDVFWRWIIIAHGESGSMLKQISLPYNLINGIIYLFKSSYKWNLTLADLGGTFRFNFWYLLN